MVYIFESTFHMSQEDKLEQVRQQLIDQIRDGVVLLPVNMRLKEVVDTPMGMDILDATRTVQQYVERKVEAFESALRDARRSYEYWNDRALTED